MAKIIIIDDEPAMVEVIVTLCREKGHQVFPFNSAAKAIEQLEWVSRAPVTDYNDPNYKKAAERRLRELR